MYCLEHYNNKNIMSTQLIKKKGKYNDFNDFYKIIEIVCLYYLEVYFLRNLAILPSFVSILPLPV